LKFTKMQGLGNDYVYIDCFSEDLTGTDLSQLAIRLSDRHFGIGGDGIILIMPSEAADFRMRMFNADGSEGKTCGNGLRCVSRYVYDHGLTDKTTFTIETLGGIVKPELILRDGAVEAVKIDMGEPRLSRSEIPMLGPDTPQVVGEPMDVGGCAMRVTCVSMGNPHCIIFVRDVESVDVAGVGPFIEKHENFPEKTNVEFIEVLNDEEILFRVWERGSGITLACGTGACAAVVAAVLNNLTKRTVTVHLLGGDLLIEWGDDNHVYMTGPAVEVFSGEIKL
jgi:diaminopimelate epimerase